MVYMVMQLTPEHLQYTKEKVIFLSTEGHTELTSIPVFYLEFPFPSCHPVNCVC